MLCPALYLHEAESSSILVDYFHTHKIVINMNIATFHIVYMFRSAEKSWQFLKSELMIPKVHNIQYLIPGSSQYKLFSESCLKRGCVLFNPILVFRFSLNLEECNSVKYLMVLTK